jgi:exosome complex component RRP4
LPCGASIIIGNNGFIWICPTINNGGEDGFGGFTENLREVRDTFRVDDLLAVFYIFR